MRSLKFIRICALVLSLMLLSSWDSKEVSIQKNKERVEFVGSKSLDINSQLVFDVKYVAKRGREVVVALKRNGVWIANGIVSVKKGEGTVKVPINVTTKLKRSRKYEIDFYLRPVGTTWEDAVTQINNMPNITID
ncbi:hypothetical protein [Aquimarina agarilytica]|uniref:hypothetical protein n=1 Tax=Aquimarina agarilytica TaxID=1087449 RepID=UPI000287FCC0|nr:hypothetical protein [Aquimarina agarilytica]